MKKRITKAYIWAPRIRCTFCPDFGGPRKTGKSAHFFGYLITLPVGTVWSLFFARNFAFRARFFNGAFAIEDPYEKASAASHFLGQSGCRLKMSHFWRIFGAAMRFFSKAMCVGSVIMLSLRLYVSVIANVCHTHCVGDTQRCECISLSLRW